MASVCDDSVIILDEIIRNGCPSLSINGLYANTSGSSKSNTATKSIETKCGNKSNVNSSPILILGKKRPHDCKADAVPIIELISDDEKVDDKSNKMKTNNTQTQDFKKKLLSQFTSAEVFKNLNCTLEPTSKKKRKKRPKKQKRLTRQNEACLSSVSDSSKIPFKCSSAVNNKATLASKISNRSKITSNSSSVKKDSCKVTSKIIPVKKDSCKVTSKIIPVINNRYKMTSRRISVKKKNSKAIESTATINKNSTGCSSTISDSSKYQPSLSEEIMIIEPEIKCLMPTSSQSKPETAQVQPEFLLLPPPQLLQQQQFSMNQIQPYSRNVQPDLNYFQDLNSTQVYQGGLMNMQWQGRNLRPIAIDGSNVAFSHGKEQFFSCRGIELCINYFLKRGHMTVKAFVPQHRRCTSNKQNVGCQILERLALGSQRVVFTPARRLHNKLICPYDDRFILEYACQTGAVVVSNDNYRDLVDESLAFRQTIEQRLLMYTFADDMFMVPHDPMGRHGPTLEEFLCF